MWFSKRRKKGERKKEKEEKTEGERKEGRKGKGKYQRVLRSNLLKRRYLIPGKESYQVIPQGRGLQFSSVQSLSHV